MSIENDWGVTVANASRMKLQIETAQCAREEMYIIEAITGIVIAQ